MKREELEIDLRKGNWIYKGVCHDCGTPVEVRAMLNEEGGIDIGGGAVFKIRIGLKDQYFFKCDKCYSKDRVLHDYQECEVFSRCVGYLRPVQQWNKGKREEFNMRKEFKNTEGL